MTWVERVRSERAALLGRYPSSSITPKTFRKVSGRSRCGALAALDTVWRDTPARFATISMVGRWLFVAADGPGRWLFAATDGPGTMLGAVVPLVATATPPSAALAGSSMGNLY
jgi:hypothetical protein